MSIQPFPLYMECYIFRPVLPSQTRYYGTMVLNSNYLRSSSLYIESLPTIFSIFRPYQSRFGGQNHKKTQDEYSKIRVKWKAFAIYKTQRSN